MKNRWYAHSRGLSGHLTLDVIIQRMSADVEGAAPSAGSYFYVKADVAQLFLGFSRLLGRVRPISNAPLRAYSLSKRNIR
jgi:hypothetical protein